MSLLEVDDISFVGLHGQFEIVLIYGKVLDNAEGAHLIRFCLGLD